MRIKKKNVARLASISALGAGALGVAAGTAQAGVVYTPLDLKIGFSPGYGNSTNVNLPGGAYYELQKMFNTSGSFYQYLNGLHGYQLVFKPGDAIGGESWNLLGSTPVSFMGLGLRQNHVSSRSRPGPGYTTTTVFSGVVNHNHHSTSTPYSYVVKSHTGTNGYFYKLFQFDYTSSYLFGWAYFHQTVSDTVGPDVDILGVAYDDSGATIAAGDTGSSVPEPSTMALTGLAALALGAKGLRRWRAARKLAA
jgi:hypothetical protein